MFVDRRPVAPLPEPERPLLHECLHREQAYFTNGTDFNPSVGYVDLVRKDNPEQAYTIDHTKEEISLNYRAPGWGRVFFAIRLPALADGVYQMPQTEGSFDRVAIKCLNINAVEKALREGKLEDPYKEINRMQTIGDNIHVLKCIEALRDEENMYIVMPYCEGGCLGDIHDSPQAIALPMFSQVLEDLAYLRKHKICHRDLSPDNIMVYKGRPVVHDLARSFQLSPESTLVIPDSIIHGKPAFQPPEVFTSSHHRRPYDAYQCDLWAAGLTLFCILTREQLLYNIPYHSDVMFRCFFLARGIAGELNEKVQECFDDADLWEEENVNEADRAERLRHAARLRQARRLRDVFAVVQSLSPEVRDILNNLLKVPPDERWDLDTVTSKTGSLHRL